MDASATSRDGILARLQDIFRAELDDDDLQISLATRQSDLKGWDSLAHVRLVSGIESEFRFQFCSSRRSNRAMFGDCFLDLAQ